MELAPFWIVGDKARVVQGAGIAGMPRRNQESVHLDLSFNSSLKEVSSWQINDFRLTWFWMGWMMDNSLRFSGEGSALSGEYFIGSLWQGDVDDPRIARRRERPQRQLPLGEDLTALACTLQQGLQRQVLDEEV